MAPKELDDRFKALEERLAKAEGARKDRWDKFQILAALLIPAAVAFAGYYFSNALAKAQTDSANALADGQRASEERRAQASQAISQAELVATFMKSLLSSDPVEKELAIRAVLLALPDSGPQLVAAVRTGSDDPKTRAAATAALDDRKAQLVADIYAGDDGVRRQASEQLKLGFRNDPSLVDTLVRAAQRHSDNAAGVYNSAVVLQAMPAQQLQAKKDEVAQFAVIANKHDERTQALVQQIHRQSGNP